MVCVGIESTTNVNPGLPDYSYNLQILIDTFITDDPNGELFHKTYEEVSKKINAYAARGSVLSEVFEEIPVVGFFFNNSNFSLTETSHRAVLTYTVIASF